MDDRQQLPTAGRTHLSRVWRAAPSGAALAFGKQVSKFVGFPFKSMFARPIGVLHQFLEAIALPAPHAPHMGWLPSMLFARQPERPRSTVRTRSGTPVRGKTPRGTTPRSFTPKQSPVVSPEQLPLVVLSVLALLQLFWFLTSGAPVVHRFAGVMLGASSLAVLVAPKRTRESRLQLLTVLGVLIVVNIAAFILTNASPIASRLFIVFIVLGYVAVGLTGAIRAAVAVPFARALTVSLFVVAPVFALESISGQFLPAPSRRNEVTLPPPAAPRPDSGPFYPPNSTAQMVYGDNSRGYFESAEVYRPRWTLYAHDTLSVAELRRDDARPESLHVQITRAKGSEDWHIQLNHDSLAIRAGVPYRLSFRVRATKPRLIAYNLWGSVEGRRSLGMRYRSTRTDSTWQSITETFRGTDNDRSARLHFNLGQDSASVYLTNVVLTDLSTGARVRPQEPVRYTVSYRFNSKGCRGGEYAAPRPPRTRRILALGDSHTLGAGVHERDTYSARLQQLLNEPRREDPSRTAYEVINCGVAGAGTADERMAYESVGRTLSPDLVILAVVKGDDVRGGDDLVKAAVQSAGAAEYFLASLGRLRHWREAKRAPAQDTERIVAEARALQTAVEANNGRLAVMVFDDGTTEAGRQVDAAITRAFLQSGVPVLSLARLLGAFAPRDLMVHPRLDAHPNDVAHRIGAEALARFLRDERLLPEQPLPAQRPTRDSVRRRR